MYDKTSSCCRYICLGDTDQLLTHTACEYFFLHFSNLVSFGWTLKTGGITSIQWTIERSSLFEKLCNAD
jgi:hypothetical protein